MSAYFQTIKNVVTFQSVNEKIDHLFPSSNELIKNNLIALPVSYILWHCPSVSLYGSMITFTASLIGRNQLYRESVVKTLNALGTAYFFNSAHAALQGNILASSALLLFSGTYYGFANYENVIEYIKYKRNKG